MSVHLLLLWRPSPVTDALVRTLPTLPDFAEVEQASVAEVSDRRLRGLRARLLRARRRGRLTYVAVDSEFDDARDDVEGVTSALASIRRRTRPVLLLPSDRHQLEQLYRDHVLAGGIEEFTAFRLREDLTERLVRWRDKAQRLVAEAGGEAVVATGTDGDAATLADAAGVSTDAVRAALEAPRGISARGLEILRRMNGFTRNAAEQRTTRRFCRKTFPARGPADLDIPDSHVWPSP